MDYRVNLTCDRKDSTLPQIFLKIVTESLSERQNALIYQHWDEWTGEEMFWKWRMHSMQFLGWMNFSTFRHVKKIFNLVKKKKSTFTRPLPPSSECRKQKNKEVNCLKDVQVYATWYIINFLAFSRHKKNQYFHLLLLHFLYSLELIIKTDHESKKILPCLYKDKSLSPIM